MKAGCFDPEVCCLLASWLKSHCRFLESVLRCEGPALFAELKDKDTIYLFDPAKGDTGLNRGPRQFRAYTIDASSPNPKNYKTFVEWVRFQLYMPTLSEAEVLARAPYFDVSVATLLAKFVKYGGRARPLFGNLAECPDGDGGQADRPRVGDDYDDLEVKKAIAKATPKQMQALNLFPDIPTPTDENGVSHVLMKMEVDESFQFLGLAPHTDYIRDRLLERFTELGQETLALVAMSPATNPHIRAKALEVYLRDEVLKQPKGELNCAARELKKNMAVGTGIVGDIALSWTSRFENVDQVELEQHVEEVAAQASNGTYSLL
jgi:hypothetical protein